MIRGREGLFLLTGFGTTVSGWPVGLEEYLVVLEPDTTPAQPAAADVDGDGDPTNDDTNENGIPNYLDKTISISNQDDN